MSKILALFSILAFLSACAVPPAPEDAPDDEVSRAADPEALACMAEAIYYEARGTGPVGTEAVGHVVLNRAESPEFPNSVCGVVADRCQFAYRCDGAPENLANAEDRRKAIATAEKVLTGAPDITRGALFFHAAWAEPGWFNSRPRIGTFGGNIFYR